MDNNTIHEFNPAIYPARIWVGIKTPFDVIEEKFWGLNDDMLRVNVTIDTYKPNHFVIARTYIVSDKKSGQIGVLVVIWRTGQFDVKTICHEAAHCADFICEQFGINTRGLDHGEPYAYLVGWIADCLNKVKHNKLK